jgi:uncharacterized SAM-binding protein YcdF (DUF218 family)
MFKILQSFLLPSVFIFLFFMLGLFFYHKKKKLSIIFILLGVFFYLFFSTIFAEFLIISLEKQYDEISEQEIKDINTLVLLLGGTKGEDSPLNSQLSESTLARAVGAAQIYFKKEGNLKIIISGSDPLSIIESSGSLVLDFFLSLGVPRENIILEEDSKNTYQSSVEVKKMVGDEEFMLVTSACHMPRAIYIFKEKGLNVFAAPSDFKGEKTIDFFDFIPDPEKLWKSDLFFHEYFGLIYYKIRY